MHATNRHVDETLAWRTIHGVHNSTPGGNYDHNA